MPKIRYSRYRSTDQLTSGKYIRTRTPADLNRVVTLSGGHRLGRILSSLSPLDSRLMGVVTIADNGGSTGRIRRFEEGIAWEDMCNCLNQLTVRPSVASAMFEHRFSSNGELSGHNLGNLMLKALDHLSMWPLEAINLVRSLLKAGAHLIPMSELSVGLMVIDNQGHEVYDEMNIDQLTVLPQELMLSPKALTTREVVEAIAKVDLILINPDGFYINLMPILLPNEMLQVLHCTSVPMVYIGNLRHELSPSTANLALSDKLATVEQYIGKKVINAVVAGPKVDAFAITDRVVIQEVLEASDIPYRHGRQLLHSASEGVMQALG